MKNKKDKVFTKLNDICVDIPNAVVKVSRRGVPHLVINSYYSVVYFYKSDFYRIFSGYATPQIKKERDVKTGKEVVDYINEMMVQEIS